MLYYIMLHTDDFLTNHEKFKNKNASKQSKITTYLVNVLTFYFSPRYGMLRRSRCTLIIIPRSYHMVCIVHPDSAKAEGSSIVDEPGEG